jgi:hypothetical protein
VANRAIPALLLAAVAIALVAAGCGLAGPSFSTSGPCLADGRAAGAYPELEAAVPKAINGRPATTVDSGRNCSDEALGTFTSRGVHEIHFAGATWDEGGGNGVTIAVLALPDRAMPLEWAEEFYQAGAIAGKHTDNIDSTRPTYPGVGTVYRLDALNDLSLQTVVIWADGPLARVIIVATQVDPSASKAVHEARVAEAVGAAVLKRQPSPSCSCSPGPVLPSP